ncbi:MAG: hypothetical protein ACI4DU_04215 [Lachnospiraceae bacterium]
MEKKNKLNTKNLPPFFTLLGGLIAFVIAMLYDYSLKNLLLAVFFSMLAFSVLGLIIKIIVDNFKMNKSYDDLFDDQDDKW